MKTYRVTLLLQASLYQQYATCDILTNLNEFLPYCFKGDQLMIQIIGLQPCL